MAQYIDKSAVVAEIEKRLSLLEGGMGDPEVMKRVEGVIKGYKSILSFLATLETKEVDLEKECKIYLKNNFASKEAPDEFLTTLMQIDDMVLFAKHFYELGLAQKGE
jgi:hypothetical protein